MNQSFAENCKDWALLLCAVALACLGMFVLLGVGLIGSSRDIWRWARGHSSKGKT